MQWVIFPEQESSISDIGGKAFALASLRKARLPIPDWFVVRSEACFECLDPDTQQQLAEATSPEAMQSLLTRIVPDELLLAEIKQALARLCQKGELVAVRSSAIDEDGAARSFAGQLQSYLFVPPEDVFVRIAGVWRSGFTEQVLAYRQQKGLLPLTAAPAVLVQRMISSEAAGVAFSADPVSGRRGISVVSAVFGLGTSLVSGEANADTWHMDRAGKMVQTQIAKKPFAHRIASCTATGVKCESLSEESALRPVLTDGQVRDVAAMAWSCASHFGRPQDIEWAIEGGRLFLLQSRPITSLTGLSDSDGVLNIWDNSNIAESYGGITTPLTYSFARRAYEEVYRQFCRLMAVSPRRIADQSQVFRCMIGLVRGRVYYNLLNWYRVLAMLPGFTINRRFMEQMMGVKEGLPQELAAELQNGSATDRAKDAFRLAFSVSCLALNHFTLRRRIEKFYVRLDQALRPPDPPLDQARPDELAAAYLQLERELLTRWDAPLVNDFFAMIFFGLLKKLAFDWCGDSNGTLQNNLLCGEGGIISAEPPRHVYELAELVAKHPDLIDTLRNSTVAKMEAALLQVPHAAEKYRAYLERFGDRCLDELKLESPTLQDDPIMLLRSIGHLAQQVRASHSETKAQCAQPGCGALDRTLEQRLRHEAEARVRVALRGHWVRKLIFFWVLKRTRDRVRDRENLRFERTRLFGRVRRIFLALGQALSAEAILDSAQDIFYLELDNILGFCDGTAATADLRGLIALRRAEFASFASMPAPADRFETRGPVCYGNSYQHAAAERNDSAESEQWKGIGCCPGIVRGPARVITDPRHAELKPGEILVAERTDPGWILLFASAAGLLVERGSLLSHSAIVSRELGLPSIVSLPGITKNLANGDEVEMNGSTGTVKRIRHD